ncbi:polysaccharide deacetylase family protein [Paenibacillus filicis]|uniref:Polysaccharide deacetylase family protein n=1 Tax=Paenibacillus gyeongsangnamensis TaxID=3388067 RepID=A0ABT4QJZ9_9BACL|nr:polysaccharide deacetylase family protein [Paenibacillus filicis]MCZ8517203.1 polysaccharide deacetylase family protein [Paenibacillus filicis]
MFPLKRRFSLIIVGVLVTIAILCLTAFAVLQKLETTAQTSSEPQQTMPTWTQEPSKPTQASALGGQQEPPQIIEPVLIMEPIQHPLAAPSSAVVDAIYKTPPFLSKVSIPVLNYHSVTIQPGNRAAITPKKLEEQMQYLAEQGYTTLSLKEFIDIWEGRVSPPTKPVLLTFDDGYKDNYTTAMPILKKYEFRATLFMSPGMVDDGYFLNWDEVKEMHQVGWDIQPHGMTHPHLPRLSAEKQEHEIMEGRHQIEEQLEITADVFCYPYGERNQVTLNILKENQFRYAFTIDQGKAAPDQNPLLLRRLFVDGEQGLSSFKALLK